MKEKIVVFSFVLVLFGVISFFYFSSDGNTQLAQEAVNSSAELSLGTQISSVENKQPLTGDSSLKSSSEPASLQNSRVVLADSQLSIAMRKEELAKKLFKIGELDYDDDWCHVMELNEAGALEAHREQGLWYEKRGHFTSDASNNYVDYDNSSLAKIGRQGDLRALYTLVNREGVDEKDKLWASKTAAVFGDTSGTAGYIGMSKLAAAKFDFVDGEGDQKEAARLNILEALAWAEFAAIRGDFSLFDTTLFVLEDIDSFQLVESEKQLISKKAQDIYVSLANERERLGLDPFDDTVPKSILRNQDLLISAAYKAENFGGWGEHLLRKSSCVDKNIKFISHAKNLAIAEN